MKQLLLSNFRYGTQDGLPQGYLQPFPSQDGEWQKTALSHHLGEHGVRGKSLSVSLPLFLSPSRTGTRAKIFPNKFQTPNIFQTHVAHAKTTSLSFYDIQILLSHSSLCTNFQMDSQILHSARIWIFIHMAVFFL